MVVIRVGMCWEWIVVDVVNSLICWWEWVGGVEGVVVVCGGGWVGLCVGSVVWCWFGIVSMVVVYSCVMVVFGVGFVRSCVIVGSEEVGGSGVVGWRLVGYGRWVDDRVVDGDFRCIGYGVGVCFGIMMVMVDVEECESIEDEESGNINISFNISFGISWEIVVVRVVVGIGVIGIICCGGLCIGVYSSWGDS